MSKIKVYHMTKTNIHSRCKFNFLAQQAADIVQDLKKTTFLSSTKLVICLPAVLPGRNFKFPDQADTPL